jgi:hypothetical protein
MFNTTHLQEGELRKILVPTTTIQAFVIFIGTQSSKIPWLCYSLLVPESSRNLITFDASVDSPYKKG